MAGKIKKIRHSKIKNAAILFELLTRRLTIDIINGVKNSSAQRLIEKYFRNTSELGKEYVLYQALVKQRFDIKEKAEDFLNEVVDAHKKLRYNEIKRSKYSLLKEIGNEFELDDFFRPKLENYKLLASIYKIFQSKSLNESISPEDVVNSKFTIIDNIMGLYQKASEQLDDVIINEYTKQDEDLRLLTYKILVEKFNEKYSGLDAQQKTLIKEYINNISQSQSLISYVKAEIPVVQAQLNKRIKRIDDKVIQIKINEVINQLKLMKEFKNYNDTHIEVMLQSYELVKEIDKIIKKVGNI
jgi:hypothetical protein